MLWGRALSVALALDPGHRRLAVVSSNFAWLRDRLDQREEAGRLSADALRIYRSLYGSDRAPPVMSAPVLPPPPKEI